ncbi:TonB-dependent receptor [Sorangium sp. So ce131]|uniref:TonB-dependent receptor n=1 Tax=Sorangium sp. So ce131 TaxID=3133282 RepID=UPI003F63FBBE
MIHSCPRRARWAAPLLALASAIAPATALAAGSAVLTGTVVDAATNRPASDVVVTVTSPALQGEQTVVTDGSGQYRIPNLPPGTYTLRLDKEAYRPYSRGGVELRLDSTIRVNTQLLPEAIQAPEIVVVASPPTVDVGSSATGVNVSSDFVSRIPLNPPSTKGGATRSFESLAEIAPGAVADRYGVSISGTSSPENQYVIDGLSVNNPGFGILGTPLSVEFVDEVNVITGGYMPEYGRSTGGYYNVATKSGSNEFHGAAFFSITPGIFEGARTRVVQQRSAITTDVSLSSLRDFGFELGGPILKDRLWFYAGVSPSFATYRLERNLNLLGPANNAAGGGALGSERLPGTTDVYYAAQESVQYLGKLTLLVDPDNTVSLSVYGTPTTSGGDGRFGMNPRDGRIEIDNSYNGGIINGPFEAIAHKYVTSATDAALKWSSAFSNKRYLLDVTLGMHHEVNAVRASDGEKIGSGKGLSEVVQVLWQRSPPRSIDEFEGSDATERCAPGDPEGETRCPVPGYYYSGGPGVLTEAVFNRYQAKAMLTSLFPALGHHVVKGGVDVEVMQYASERGESGGTILTEAPDGSVLYDYRRHGFLNGPDDPVHLTTYKAESTSLTIGGFVQDSWSIVDRVTLNAGVRYDAQLIYGYDGELGMSLPNQWSPRVGVIYDVTQSGRSKLYANYARYYESVPLNIADRMFPGERLVVSVRDPALCDPRSDEQIQGACESDDSRVVIDGPHAPNQKWGVVGADRTPVDPELDPQSSDEIVVGAEYEIAPKLRIGAEYTKRWQNRIIEDLSRDEAKSYFVANPGHGAASDFPEAVRNYDAFTLYAEKVFSGGWLGQASYRISSLRGNWSGLFRPETQQIDPNMNTDFDLLSLLPNREGPLPGDRRHQIKLYGAKDFVFGPGFVVNLGGAYRARSGAPTSHLGAHLQYGPDEIFILPRGSGERLPWVHDIDVHLGVGVQLARDSALLFAVDAFNVFNFQAVTAVDERYTAAQVLPIPGGTKGDLAQLQNADGTPFDAVNKNPNFGHPVAYQAPRTFRLSAKVTF